MEAPPKKITLLETAIVFAICALPINIWAIINTLYFIPSWILYRDLWDLTGAVAYVLFFSLIEICGLFVLIMIGGFLTPKRWLKNNFIAFSTVIVIEATTIAIALHYFPKLLWQKKAIAFVFVLVFVVAAILINRFPALRKGINTIVERISVLSFIYLILNVVALVIVVIRNYI